MEVLFAVWLVTWVIMRVPAALADSYEARKAADAGEWGHLDGMRQSRDARTRRVADMAGRILERRQAKADGEPKRPGLGTWAGDVWHGAWEDALDRRAARRDARDPFDPSTPTLRQRAVDRLRHAVAERRAKRAGDTGESATDNALNDTVADEAAHILARKPCPTCGDTITRTEAGWAHPDGPNCPRTGVPYRPSPRSRPDTAATPTRALDDNNPKENPMTAPTIEDVQTNEAARRAFDQISAAADKLAEAAAMAEQARAQMAAAANAAVDGMAGVKFDAGATAAASEAADAVSTGTISDWCEKADAARAAAAAGKNALEKYRDAEDVVASNNVDARTLEPSAA